MDKIKGVNLGNWLVLEKWMSPELFEGTDAEDEYYLPRALPKEIYEERIRRHRAEYITERDFAFIKSYGLNAVRIPIPYFIFGDYEPFVGCIRELDDAFDWAERYGLQILIDLHTAPDSQNGFDNGGISGVCKFFQEPEEIEYVYTVLERLAERYGSRKGLFGIEVLNEPIPKEWFKYLAGRYMPVDPEKAAGSRGYEREELRTFYLTAYDRIMQYLPYDKKVVLHDGFDILQWKDFMREEKYRNVVLDTHQYLFMTGMEDPTLEEIIEHINTKFAPAVQEMQQYFPVVCGEWCLSNPLPFPDLPEEEQKKIFHTLDAAQKAAWDLGSGYFYWSYKLHVNAAQVQGHANTEPWDLGRCVAHGWFEKEN